MSLHNHALARVASQDRSGYVIEHLVGIGVQLTGSGWKELVGWNANADDRSFVLDDRSRNLNRRRARNRCWTEVLSLAGLRHRGRRIVLSRRVA